MKNRSVAWRPVTLHYAGELSIDELGARGRKLGAMLLVEMKDILGMISSQFNFWWLFVNWEGKCVVFSFLDRQKVGQLESRLPCCDLKKR